MQLSYYDMSLSSLALQKIWWHFVTEEPDNRHGVRPWDIFSSWIIYLEMEVKPKQPKQQFKEHN